MKKRNLVRLQKLDAENEDRTEEPLSALKVDKESKESKDEK